MNETSQIFAVIYETVQSSDSKLSITDMCSIAGVSRSGYYRWLAAAPLREEKELQDQKDFSKILEAYSYRGYSKGARGIYMRLLHMDPPVRINVKKIRRLMKKYNLRCPIRKANPYRRMAKALRTNNVAENLVQREFECYGPRTILLTDITYIPYNGEFAYLSTILDAYTKQVLSYVLSPSLELDFVLETVNQLIENHGSSLKTESVVHSDQGCHYTSYRFIEILSNNALRQSMSRKGNCWDNAPQESFYGHMKDRIDISQCLTFDDVKYVIDDYMDYYNNDFYIWELAKLSPNEYYEFVTTGIYPLNIENPPSVPVIDKPIEELGQIHSET